jgi:D-xylose transport system substrate-binding protein
MASAVLLLAVGLAACGTNKGGSSTGGGGGQKGKIALLLPETKTARYEAQDRPLFENKVKALCPNCTVDYSNADQDASKQQQQAEAAITNGASVLVLDPVDSASAAAIVNRAKQSNIPVISYDRLITNAPIAYYISFDNIQVGKLQATSLVNRLKAKGKGNGKIIMINGAPTDNNAKLFKQGAHSVLDSSGIKIAKEYDTPDWSPDKAQSEAQQAITALGNNGFDGIYAANDGTAGGAIAAMKGAGIDPSTKPTTGQDAELAGIQRIVAGDQYMTVYKAYKPEAETAATIAVALTNGKSVPSGVVNKKVSNGQKDVDSVILTPVAVTTANVKDTVVKDGLWSINQICAGSYAAACKKAGLQ